MIPDAAVAQNTIALGKTRAGKSSKMRLIVERLLDHAKPVCIIDPKGDWWGIKSSADGKKAGYPLIIFGGEHADVPINEHSGAHIAELIATGNRPCLIDLGGWMVGARTRFFIEFASTMFKLTKGARWLVVDECHNFAPQGKILDPDAGKMLHWANRLASEGSGKGLTLISASQRPQKVHKDYLTSHETLIACRVIHKLDRDAIKDWIDGNADPAIGKEVMASLAEMERPQAWVWSPEIKFGPKLITFPMFKTYDSFKPQGADAPATLKGWASIDLNDVKAKLAAVVEESKANDPKALKAALATAQAELAKLRRSPVPASGSDKKAAVDHKAMDRAIAAARAEGHTEGYIAGDRDGFARGAEAALSQGFQAIQGAMKAFAGIEFVPSRRAPKPAPAAIAAQSRPEARSTGFPKSAPQVNRLPDTGLPTPHRRVIASLSFWVSVGHEAPTREQVAGVAGYSPGSGGYNNILGALSTAGLIEKPQAGRVSLSASAPHIPMDAGEAKAKLLSILTGPELKVVAAVADGGIMTRDQVAEDSGYSPGSGGFNNILGHLNTLCVLTKPGTGTVQLSDWAREVLG